tara:strand:- start:77810 stop:77926 length:117 start_codon:yes stop_codon:yes gene_type:complete
MPAKALSDPLMYTKMRGSLRAFAGMTIYKEGKYHDTRK